VLTYLAELLAERHEGRERHTRRRTRRKERGVLFRRTPQVDLQHRGDEKPQVLEKERL
jgi:hypothetical protein